MLRFALQASFSPPLLLGLLLGLSLGQIQELAKDIIFGQMRVVMATMPIEEINADRDKLIASLKPREQIVVRLLDLEERSIREASEITGWSASKIKTAAMRARRKLAEKLRFLEAGPAPANPSPHDPR